MVLNDLPNLTTIRKSGATAAVSSLNKDNMELLSSHMSHSSSTSERYYRHRERDASAVTAFDKIRSISGELIIQSTQIFTIFLNIADTLPTKEEPQRGFSNSMVQLMKEDFCQEIAEGRRPTLKKCRDFIQKHKINKRAKQIQDKVFNIIKSS